MTHFAKHSGYEVSQDLSRFEISEEGDHAYKRSGQRHDENGPEESSDNILVIRVVSDIVSVNFIDSFEEDSG